MASHLVYPPLLIPPTNFQSVKRPDFGTLGSRVELTANHYRLKKLPEITIYQYAVSIIISGWKSDRRIPIRVGKCIMGSEPVEKALGAAKKGFVYDGILPSYISAISFHFTHLW